MLRNIFQGGEYIYEGGTMLRNIFEGVESLLRNVFEGEHIFFLKELYVKHF